MVSVVAKPDKVDKPVSKPVSKTPTKTYKLYAFGYCDNSSNVNYK